MRCPVMLGQVVLQCCFSSRAGSSMQSAVLTWRARWSQEREGARGAGGRSWGGGAGTWEGVEAGKGGRWSEGKSEGASKRGASGEREADGKSVDADDLAGGERCRRRLSQHRGGVDCRLASAAVRLERWRCGKEEGMPRLTVCRGEPSVAKSAVAHMRCIDHACGRSGSGLSKPFPSSTTRAAGCSQS
eukprot:3939015-Rhodomonas_salina.1